MKRKPPLYAMTLWPEWAFAVACLEKDCENRAWKALPRWLEGQWLAVHAGATPGGGQLNPEEACSLVAETYLHATGDPIILRPEVLTLGAFVALAKVARVGYGSRSLWAALGAWQIEFSRVITLASPIPARGYQKLWKPSEADVDLLRSAWQAGAGTHHDRSIAWGGRR